MADLTPVFLCFKWGKGYPCKYTNILYRALSDIMTGPFRLICLTNGRFAVYSKSSASWANA
ncbi:hypothetical protein [Yoonia sp. R2-816]|uniref:hypothetical protein n=1 Tax=Yoonia sp. R2-816 TaxID=3342638 RepID=UPI003729D1A1